MFPFLVKNLELIDPFNKFFIFYFYFLKFHWLYYSVSINESKEKFKIFFYCILVTGDIVAT